MRSIVLTLTLAAALSGCNPPTVAKRPPLPVRIVVAAPSDYAQKIAITGEIAARVSSNLSFRISGRVIERDVDVGKHVEAGEVLARLDPTSAQSDVDSADAAVLSAQATLKQAAANYDRQKQLFDSGFATRSTYDVAQQNQLTAQSALDAAKAQAGTATDALTYATLKAQRPGVVTARSIEVGQVALSAQTAFTVAEDGPRDAVFNVFESIFFARPASDGVALTLVANPAVTAHGRVREISPTVNATGGTVTVKVGLDEGADKMPLGAAVIGRGNFAARQVVSLPWTAVASDAGRLAVWIVDPQSLAVSMKRVTAESFENDTLLVADGLTGGEHVVTAGGKFLYPGEIVAPQEPVSQEEPAPKQGSTP